ncbi:MAG: exodeoxyribonuclease VII large subunit [Firmicutes bacterium]|jgi:exodeoxyribonuclease VII large subunit|nr:exodeoxyribonuclease VII large subunit [Bacillota bacterium]
MNLDLTRTLSVGEVTTYIKQLFAADPLLSRLQVSGEISNFKHHSSGHMYFTLKDSSAALRCVMFRSANRRLTFRPADGMKVIAAGRLSVYERDGLYQLYVEDLLPEGVGSLYTAFAELKARLEAEGLFRPERKKPLPRYPRRIGVVTSPTGAAVRDIVTTLGRRFPLAEALIVPVLVQGPEAPQQIAEALDFLNSVPGIDVIIAGRGGGSIEELWAFNEEVVARAIYRSYIPVISAVGHETDFTIADFVADVRAATPTAAAELAVPDMRELEKYFLQAARRLVFKLKSLLEQEKRYLQRLASARVLTRPLERVEAAGQVLDNLFTRLEAQATILLQNKTARLELLAAKLAALNPAAVLERGFAICYDQSGNVVANSTNLATGDRVLLRFRRGSADAAILQSYLEEKQDE